MTFQEFTARHNRALTAAIRVDALIRARADRAAARAGLPGQRNVWRNAIIAREWGYAWDDVDYSALREAIAIDKRRARVWPLVDRIYDRLLPETA